MIHILFMLWIPAALSAVLMLVFLVVLSRRNRRNSGTVWHDPAAYPGNRHPAEDDIHHTLGLSGALREVRRKEGWWP